MGSMVSAFKCSLFFVELQLESLVISSSQSLFRAREIVIYLIMTCFWR